MRRVFVGLLLVSGCHVDVPYEPGEFVCSAGSCVLTIEVANAGRGDAVEVYNDGDGFICGESRCRYKLPARSDVRLASRLDFAATWSDGEAVAAESREYRFTLNADREVHVDFTRPDAGVVDASRPDASTIDAAIIDASIVDAGPPDTGLHRDAGPYVDAGPRPAFFFDGPHVMVLLDGSASIRWGLFLGDCPYDRMTHPVDGGVPPLPLRLEGAQRGVLNGCETATDGLFDGWLPFNAGIIATGPSVPSLRVGIGASMDELRAAVESVEPNGPMALDDGLMLAVAHLDSVLTATTTSQAAPVHFVVIADGLNTASITRSLDFACDGSTGTITPGGPASTRSIVDYIASRDVLCNLAGDQRIVVHIISLARGATMLRATAEANGGLFIEARDPYELFQAFVRIFEEISR